MSNKNRIFEEWQVTRSKLLGESFDENLIQEMFKYIKQVCEGMKQVSSSLEGSEITKTDPSIKGDMQRILAVLEKFEEDFFKMKQKIEKAQYDSKEQHEHSETPKEEETEHSSGSDNPEGREA